MATVMRFRALPLLSLFCSLFISHLGGPDLFGIEICMAQDESLPLAELRAEAKAERDAELLYLKEETVSIAAG